MLVKTVSNEHFIDWPQRAINEKVYLHFVKLFRLSRNYAHLDAKQIKKYDAERKQQNRLHSSDVTMSQLLSIRNATVKQKIISRHALMNKLMHKMAAQYQRGVGILELSCEFDFPPLNLLRGILLHLGHKPSDMWNLFSQREPAARYLSRRDLSEYATANDNDAENIINQRRTNEIALENEAIFVRHLTSLGIKLKTQDELTIEQIKLHGRATSTPDVLFVDNVYINGILTKWIDFKDYVGTPTKFLLASNREQSNRYNKLWGPGALCYSKGFVDITCAGTQILSGENIRAQFI